MTISRFFLSVLLVAILGGCGGRSTPTPKAPAGRDESGREDITEKPSPDGPQTDASVPGDQAAADPTSGEGEGDAAETVGDNSQSASPSPSAGTEPRERFLLLLPNQPLIVDLIVTIHSQPHDIALRRLVDQDLASADINRDGRTTWKELANSTRFRYGEFEYNPAPMQQMFDSNQDYVVNRDEFLRFLDRNAGATKSFVLRSSNEYRYRSRSRALELLDDDQDGVITTREMDQVATRLMQFDTDDDEIVTMTDLKADAEPTTGLLTGRRSEQPDVALQIGSRTDWGYIWYSMSELYSMGGPVAAADISLTSDVAESLDADQDGMVSEKEMERLRDMPPHLTVRASFGETEGSTAGSKGSVQLQDVSEQLLSIGALVGDHKELVAFSLPDACVTIFVTEDSMMYNASVEAVDANRDGKIADYELARFMQRRQDTVGGLVRAWVAGHEDSLFAALDTGGDGFLSTRELHEAPDRLRALDRNADGRLSSSEIPTAIVVGLIRGNPQRDTELFALPSAIASAAPSHSRWFTAMDSNRDGEISRREFLGTAEQFEQLDRNTDGFIGPGEAVSAQEM